MTKDVNIIEIFSSIQGESPYIGYRQIFIRFAGCNLACDYCDTPFLKQEFCNIEKLPGSNEFIKFKNPVSSDELLEKVLNLNNICHHSISLTGGEPLLNSDFIAEFLSKLKEKNHRIKIFLETNGTLYKELEEIINYVDIISMDLKLKSSTGKDFPFEEHKKFIEVAQNNKKEIFAKAVVTAMILDEEVDKISDFIKIPLILQPISSNNKKLLLSPQKILQIQENFLKKLHEVRVIPQTHKYLDLL